MRSPSDIHYTLSQKIDVSPRFETQVFRSFVVHGVHSSMSLISSLICALLNQFGGKGSRKGREVGGCVSLILDTINVK